MNLTDLGDKSETLVDGVISELESADSLFLFKGRDNDDVTQTQEDSDSSSNLTGGDIEPEDVDCIAMDNESGGSQSG